MENKIIDNKFKAFMFMEEDNLLYFFNGFNYELISISELDEINTLIKSNIDNYNSYVENTEYLNDKKRIESEEWLNLLNNKNPKTKKTIFPGYIYIAFCSASKYYKIGMTKRSVSNRIKQLKTGNPSIELFTSFKVNDIVIEKKIHGMFESKRIENEWFSLNGHDLNKIKKYINDSQF